MHKRDIFPAALLSAAVFFSMGIAAAEEWPAALRDAQTKCEQEQAMVQDIAVVEDLVMHVPQGDMTSKQMLYRKGAKSRIETVTYLPGGALDSIVTIVISDGVHGWAFNSATGKTELTPEEAQEQSRFSDCWDFTPDNSKITGSETVQGRECHVVELVRDSITHTLWLEKENARVIQGQSQTPGAAVQWVLSDFRPVIGTYEYPFKVEMVDGSDPLSTMTVTSVEVNKGIPDDVFDPDKVQLPQIDMEELMKRIMEQSGEPTEPSGDGEQKE